MVSRRAWPWVVVINSCMFSGWWRSTSLVKSLSISGKSGGISTVFAKLALLFCSIFLFLLSDTIKNLQIIIVAIHTYDVDITSRIRIFRRLSKINQNKADLPYLQHLVVARTVPFDDDAHHTGDKQGPLLIDWPMSVADNVKITSWQTRHPRDTNNKKSTTENSVDIPYDRIPTPPDWIFLVPSTIEQDKETT